MKIFILLIAVIIALSSCAPAEEPNTGSSAIYTETPTVNVVYAEDEDNGGITDEKKDGDMVRAGDEATYFETQMCWGSIDDLDQFVNFCDIFIGKVTGVSFRVEEEPYEDKHIRYRVLYSIYDVDVITAVKGETIRQTQVKSRGGIKGDHIEEQLDAIIEDAALFGITMSRDDAAKRAENLSSFEDAAEGGGFGLYISDSSPDIRIGETYLFMLDPKNSELISHWQGVYNIRDPYQKDYVSIFSAKDIISYFGDDKWEEFLGQEW